MSNPQRDQGFSRERIAVYRTIVHRKSLEGDPYFRILVGPNYTQIHCCKVWCYKENPLAKTGWLAARPLQFGDGSVAEEEMGGNHRILSLTHRAKSGSQTQLQGFHNFLQILEAPTFNKV